jgi:hypothetical protein
MASKINPKKPSFGVLSIEDASFAEQWSRAHLSCNLPVKLMHNKTSEGLKRLSQKSFDFVN